MQQLVLRLSLILTGTVGLIIVSGCSHNVPLLVAVHHTQYVDQVEVGRLVGNKSEVVFVGAKGSPPKAEQAALIETALGIYRTVTDSEALRRKNARIEKVMIDDQASTVTLRLSNCEYFVLSSKPAQSDSALDQGRSMSAAFGRFPIVERGVWQPCRA